VSGARGSDAPAERAEGDVRSVGAECDEMRALQDKAPLGSSESTRAARNCVSLSDRNVAKGLCTEVGGRDKCRIDAVPIGRQPMSRPVEGD